MQNDVIELPEVENPELVFLPPNELHNHMYAGHAECLGLVHLYALNKEQLPWKCEYRCVKCGKTWPDEPEIGFYIRDSDVDALSAAIQATFDSLEHINTLKQCKTCNP